MFVRVVLLVLHVASATLLFAAPLGLPRVLRNGLRLGDEPFRVAVDEALKRSRMAQIGSLLTLLTGVALIFNAGGFGRVSPNFHAALGLMLLAIAFSAAWMGPNTGKLVQSSQPTPVDKGGAEGAIKKLAMGAGVLHTLWFILLVLMFVRF
jgi:hypothetical protein